MTKNRCVIDWLSFTTKIHDPRDIINLLGLEDLTWQNIKGAHGYKDRLYCGYVSIHFNGSPEQGVWLEMSGKGCRFYEDFGKGNYDEIFKLILLETEDIHITRLDIAFDEFNGMFNINDFYNDIENGNYTSKWRSYTLTKSSEGISVVLGSKASDILLRIYDKAAEQNVDYHWIRLELQLRDERALGFLRSYQTGSFKIGQIFIAVINNYVRFLQVNNNDSNKRRWETALYWQNFIKNAERISIYDKPGFDYDLADLEDFVLCQAGNATKTLIEIIGIDNYLQQLKNMSFRKNPKYEFLKSIYN